MARCALLSALVLSCACSSCGGRAVIDSEKGPARADASGGAPASAGMPASAGVPGASGMPGTTGAAGMNAERTSADVACPPDGSSYPAYAAIVDQPCATFEASCQTSACSLSCTCIVPANKLSLLWDCIETPCYADTPISCPNNPTPDAVDTLAGEPCLPVGATCGVGGCTTTCRCQTQDGGLPRWLCVTPDCPPPR